MTDKAVTDRLISGSFKCAVQLSDRRQFEVSGYFYGDDTLSEMHQRVDMAQDVLDRQMIRADMVTKQAQIEGLHASEQAIRDNFEELMSLVQGGKNLTSQQQQILDNFEPSLNRSKRAVQDLEAAIAAGRMRLNGHGPS